MTSQGLNAWPDEVRIHTDGACRGNPGPSSIGIVVFSPDGELIYSYGAPIGQTTNNVAEYTAVVRALEQAVLYNVRRLTICSDSELLVRQLNGIYKVKSPLIQPLHRRIVELKTQFSRGVAFNHVRRELNTDADKMANRALDEGGEISE